MQKTPADLAADALDAIDILLSSDARRMKARDAVVLIVHHVTTVRGRGSFAGSCKYFVKEMLPHVGRMPELDKVDRLLSLAGFGGERNGDITVQMLRNWERDAALPSPDEIDTKKAWYTAEELTSLARAGHLPELPTTLRGMERLLSRQLSMVAKPTDVRRRVGHDR